MVVEPRMLLETLPLLPVAAGEGDWGVRRFLFTATPTYLCSPRPGWS